MRESALEKKCNALAVQHGWLPIKLSDPGMNGLPDRLYLGPVGRVFLVEFKQKRGRVAELQRRAAERLTEMGFAVEVVREVEQFRRLLDDQKPLI